MSIVLYHTHTHTKKKEEEEDEEEEEEEVIRYLTSSLRKAFSVASKKENV